VSAEDHRQNALLRTLVDAVQQEGYTLIERRSADTEYALLMRRKRAEDDEITQELLLVTHEQGSNRVRADVYMAESADAPPYLARTRYRYYACPSGRGLPSLPPEAKHAPSGHAAGVACPAAPSSLCQSGVSRPGHARPPGRERLRDRLTRG
jgi:hypothetical protein